MNSKRAFSGTDLVEISISAFIVILSENCCVQCRSLVAIKIKSGSSLLRIQTGELSQSLSVWIIIPASVETLDEGCFA
jgi:hypothetical protein